MSEEQLKPKGPAVASGWRQLGYRITELRRDRLMSQSELGRTIGLSVAYIASVERGQHRPRTSRLRKLGMVLGTDYRELAELAGYPSVTEATARTSHARGIEATGGQRKTERPTSSWR